jgi:hypothetical protein
MTGDLRHVPLGALAVESRIGSQLDKSLLSDKRKQVVFHVHDDYVTQQAQ